jgi:glutathione S-transferase
MDKLKVSALRWVPPFAQGLVRDLRVRWALEEVGQPYDVRIVGPEDQKGEEYRKLQPFGQVPAVETDGIAFFESGAIVLHIAEQSEVLMPRESKARALVKTWIFAALNTVETPVMMLNAIDMQPKDVAEGTGKLRAATAERVAGRLDAVSTYLGDRHYLVADRFTAADLLLTTVLRALRTTDLVTKRATLDAYRTRNEARPGFQRALAAQLETFAANAPAKPS